MWIDEDRFDINAVVAGSWTPPQMSEILARPIRGTEVPPRRAVRSTSSSSTAWSIRRKISPAWLFVMPVLAYTEPSGP